MYYVFNEKSFISGIFPGWFLMVFISVLSSCNSEIKDNDNNVYRTVRIGTQIWMSQNLNVSRFRNGDVIPEAENEEEWISAGMEERPAWCYYDNREENAVGFGKLYNYYAVCDSRGLAPEGWHVPSDAEWEELTGYLGGETLAGKKLKAKEGWNHGLNGTDRTHFSGLPGGNRSSSGTFDFKGIGGFWWSSTESLTGDVWMRYLTYGDDAVHKFYGSKIKGLSVRCLKDKTSN